MRPPVNSYPAYFSRYISLIEEDNIQEALQKQTEKAINLFSFVTEEKSAFRYANDKWSIKEVLQHVVDAERIFCYRALTIARKDHVVLSPFDEKEYAWAANANRRTWRSLLEEFSSLRASTQLLFDSFNDENLNTSGRVSDYNMTVLALGYSVAGHAQHHGNVIQERYLSH